MVIPGQVYMDVINSPDIFFIEKSQTIKVIIGH